MIKLYAVFDLHWIGCFAKNDRFAGLVDLLVTYCALFQGK